MSRSRAAAGLLAAGLLLTGCATDVEGELRRSVADLSNDANAGDADAVRRGADDLIAQANDAVRGNDIDPQRGARIIELATLLRDRAGALGAVEPTPTPSSPSPTPSSPTPTPSTPPPTPSPTPSSSPPPTQEPTPTEAPTPTQQPTPVPTADPPLPPAIPNG